jgi:hypothetical protein
MMRMTPEVGFAGSSPLCDLSEAQCLYLALRWSDRMFVHSITLKVAKGDWKPSVVRSSMMSVLNLKPRQDAVTSI